MVLGGLSSSASEKDNIYSNKVEPNESNGLLQGPAANAPDSCVAIPDLVVGSDTAPSASDPEGETDPWALPELKGDTSPKWSELNFGQKVYRVSIQWIGKFVALLGLLYLFVCSLDFLSSAFRLLGGKAAGSAFSDSSLLQNPIAGLMIGVLATVLVQSSSTSSSIIVTMVASGILEVGPAIPIIMGANIGTSVTNTIVSLAQSPNKDEFRRAFAGATVHDMFNWLSVFVLLPLEIATGYMYRLTSAMVAGYSSESQNMKSANADMLQTITKPFTQLVVQLDSKVIEGIALGDEKYANSSLLKRYCRYLTYEVEVNSTEMLNVTSNDNDTSFLNFTTLKNVTVSIPTDRCTFLFNYGDLNDKLVGAVLLIISLVILCGCLILMVKLLNSALRGGMMLVVKKVINADLPGPFSFLTGYIAMLVGAGLTMVVQSSSVFTSALTPLVGIGVIKLERVYPLTLGSNIGTTTTGILASLAASSDRLKPALQIALCHMCFNVSGILLFYPIPFMRFPIKLAKMMGNTTAKYRWFAIFYVAVMFFLLPMAVFGLSMAGMVAMTVVVCTFLLFVSVIIVINILQRKHANWLPGKLQNWDFLPYKWMHSLEPFDRAIMKVKEAFSKVLCCCCKKTEEKPDPPKDVEMSLIQKSNSDDGNASQDCDSVILHNYLESHHIVPMQWSSTKSIVRTDCDSGYVTRVNTPNETPCMSRLPSYVSFRAAIPECDEH